MLLYKTKFYSENSLGMCICGLQDFFDIPDYNKLRFLVYDRPGVYRYPFVIKRPEYDPEIMENKNALDLYDGYEPIQPYGNIYALEDSPFSTKALMKIRNKKIWVEMEYQE